MTLTIDLGPDPAHLDVTVGPSPLGELTGALHVLSAPVHHPTLHGWVTTVSASLPADLADRIDAASFLWQVGRADFLVPSRVRGTLAEDLDDLDALDDETFLAAAFLPACGAARTRLRADPSAERVAASRERARELAEARGPRQAEFVDRLLGDLPGIRAWLRRLFTDCEAAFFGDAWRRVHVGLVNDAREKAALLARSGLGAAVAAMSPALSVEGRRLMIDKMQDGVGAVDGRGITFAPTAFGWPHVVVLHADGWRPVVQYPVPASAPAPPIPLDLLRRRMEALAHPVRMRLCRSLARGPHSTGELAEAWDLTAPEVSRHLAALRRAGLLETSRRGRYTLHRLDLVAVSRLGADAAEALLR